MISAILLGLSALGLAALGARYLFGDAPADHHVAILAHDGLSEVGPVQPLFRTLYTVLGSSFLAIALGVGTLAVGPILQGASWAAALAVGMALVAGIPSAIVAYRSEQRTGVRTPWRSAAFLTLLVVAGGIVAVF